MAVTSKVSARKIPAPGILRISIICAFGNGIRDAAMRLPEQIVSIRTGTRAHFGCPRPDWENGNSIIHKVNPGRSGKVRECPGRMHVEWIRKTAGLRNRSVTYRDPGFESLTASWDGPGRGRHATAGAPLGGPHPASSQGFKPGLSELRAGNPKKGPRSPILARIFPRNTESQSDLWYTL